ncbi:chemotaxis protein CheD [Paenibacillus hodogayensis]|uniref:Probable chemoreceptor glutamine deamidase CheD n=1 Tax=Paenibacillus hodogayensis TaxID=279208 RepID=A0ABV5W2T8_9BACL
MIQDQLIKVGMADLNVASVTGILKTTGLGSCVGVTLYDPKVKVAGMAHVMLPSSDIAKEGNLNIAKYADTAIPELVRRMNRLGAANARLVAKLAGGAQMFAFQTTSDTMRIGPRNVESCKVQLRLLSIPVLAEDTGGNHGRTIEFHSESGILVLRTVQQGVKEQFL